MASCLALLDSLPLKKKKMLFFKSNKSRESGKTGGFQISQNTSKTWVWGDLGTIAWLSPGRILEPECKCLAKQYKCVHLLLGSD